MILDIGAIQARIAAVRALHKIEYRWHDGSGEWSFDTAEEAADYADSTTDQMRYFEVCSHCAELEMRYSANADADFRDSLWPCETIRALDGAS